MRISSKRKVILLRRLGRNNPIVNFNWNRIIFPFSTYFKLKYGRVSVLLYTLDLTILVIPFSTVIVVLLVKFVLDDVE
jgi:hypothetical protein